MKSSAYLSVFDDWQLLGPAMASIAPRVDEIVVVDGGYDWMLPFLAAEGRDPAKSVPEVWDVLAPYAAKTRWVTGVWPNEMAKRMAGYAACSHRWVWRLDADEVHFVDEGALDRFFAGGHAVGQMELPTYLVPGLIRGRAGGPIERNSLLFDTARVDAHAHLSALWLVAPTAERATLAPVAPGWVAPDPIAFTAHLTGWRPPTTAVNRARFYVLNYLREHPGPRHPVFRYDAQLGFTPMADALQGAGLAQLLMGHPIVTGLQDMDGMALVPTKLTHTQDASLTPLYAAYLEGLTAANTAMAQRGRVVAAGDDQHIDLSTAAATAPFLDGGALHFSYAEPIHAARAIMVSLHRDAPFEVQAQLAVGHDGHDLRVTLPPEPRPALRRVLRLAAWPAAGEPLLHLRARR